MVHAAKIDHSHHNQKGFPLPLGGKIPKDEIKSPLVGGLSDLDVT